ncbi:MAG: hypothetical protein AAF960_19135 [Bacteroidota bacterium]
MRITLVLSLVVFLMVSCKNDAKKSAPAAETTPAPVAKKYTITPFAASTEYADAEIKSMYYKDGKFTFEVAGENYQLGEQTPDAAQKMCANSGKGQHIHLIVGKAPYAAKYVPEFDHEVADGEHHLLAFLSRSYHESIKNGTAYVGLKATMENGSMTKSDPIMEPTLFYSRPKGTYVGKANTDKVMLDFYVLNAELGPDYTVKASINGEEHTFDKWQPYYIEGLPMGDNTIELTLLDKDGKAVASPINPVSRTFTLKADPVENS